MRHVKVLLSLAIFASILSGCANNQGYQYSIPFDDGVWRFAALKQGAVRGCQFDARMDDRAVGFYHGTTENTVSVRGHALSAGDQDFQAGFAFPFFPQDIVFRIHTKAENYSLAQVSDEEINNIMVAVDALRAREESLTVSFEDGSQWTFPPPQWGGSELYTLYIHCQIAHLEKDELM